MKIKIQFILITLALLSALNFQLSTFAQGTTFTYQGRLTDAGNPANGLYDLRVTIHDALTGGATLGGPITNGPVAANNGLFTVLLDFGASPFMGAELWLEIGVRTNGGAGNFATLQPRQPLTPAPYALHAANAGGLMSFANAPLDLKANGERILRLEPTPVDPGFSGVPNVIGGSGDNIATGIGATIAGGGASQFGGSSYPNRVTDNFGTVGGGFGNTADDSATVGGGTRNTASGDGSTVAGGGLNVSSGTDAVVGGGELNVSSGRFAVVAGGRNNNSSGESSAVGGGEGNSISTNGNNAVIAGGATNLANALFATIGGGQMNVVSANAQYSFIGGGLSNIAMTNSSGSVISGGSANVAKGPHGTVGGGQGNRALEFATVAGGRSNDTAPYAAIGGGSLNVAGPYAAVSGGQDNRAFSQYAAIGGGLSNYAFSNYTAIGGGYVNTCYGEYSTIGGGQQNRTEAEHATIGGGFSNLVGGRGATTGGGRGNWALGELAFVGGGSGATAAGLSSTIAGGSGNQIQTNADFSTIGGGLWNEVRVGALHSTIGGGKQNVIGTNAQFATVPGGLLNVAGGNYTFAAGRRAKANHDGAFVWADSSDFDFPSAETNEFAVRAMGGVRLVSGIDTNGAQVSGVSLPAGSGSWSSLSDRNAKTNFTPVNPRAVLERLAKVPIQTWNYRTERPSTRHIGPVAQDFAAAFGVGPDGKHITTVDADGVALAAIQGLNQKLEEREALLRQELQRRDAENAELKRRLAEMERNNDEREARLVRLEKAAEPWNGKPTGAVISRVVTRNSSR